jgi:hypothetical protein
MDLMLLFAICVLIVFATPPSFGCGQKNTDQVRSFEEKEKFSALGATPMYKLKNLGFSHMRKS